jgi:hypothetical protein
MDAVKRELKSQIGEMKHKIASLKSKMIDIEGQVS